MAIERAAPGESAFEFLFSDLVEHIMSLADNPRRCIDFIATEIRDIVGAKTILVFEELRLASVLPERRRALSEDSRIREIAALGYDFDGGTFVEAGGGTEIGALLAELGIGETIVLPLRYAETKSGLILLLDLLDKANVRSLLSTFDRLSPILALIMRNAYLYENLEAEVERRTRELEAKSVELKASLREKDILLQEVHHRVKNNLQIVNSLLYLRMRGIEDEKTRSLFAESQNRVLAIALVHEELYRSPDLSRIDMREYISKLVDRLISISTPPISARFDLESIRLSPDEAIPCGLLIDELVMNAQKHAFAGRASGKIEVSMRRRADKIEILVADDGPGMDPALLDGHGGGLGFSIILSLADQLHGILAVEPGPGTRFRLTFPSGWNEA